MNSALQKEANSPPSLIASTNPCSRNQSHTLPLSRPYRAKKCGLTREEIAEAIKSGQGGKLTTYLKELEQSDFIRQYHSYGNRSKNTLYQLIDPFTLYYYKFMSKAVKDPAYWSKMQGRQPFTNWSGLAFERLCLLHVRQIVSYLGVGGIITNALSWTTKANGTTSGAQIDLLIDRSDGAINLCEMKYCLGPYKMSAKDEEALLNRYNAFNQAIKGAKAIHPTLISPDGLTPNQHSGLILKVVTMEAFFLSEK